MKKLVKYVKPYLFMIFLSVGLLFAQANLDLQLPDYLSNIIDTGIQQGGVENAAPLAIRQQEMDRLFIFISSTNQTVVLESYTLVMENSSDFSEYVIDYPILQNESLYIRNKLKRKEIRTVSDILERPFVGVFILEQAIANPENATALWDALGVDPSTLPPGMDLFDYLESLPFINRKLILKGIISSFEAMGKNMVSQMAAFAVRQEYETIGMNMNKLQRNYILKAGGLMLLMTLLSVVCTISVGFLSAKIAAGMARDIRAGLFEKIEGFSGTEFDSFSTASLITRSTNDVTQIQAVTSMIIRMVFYAPILGIGGIIHALNKNTSMWWLIGVAVLALLVLVLTVFLIAVPKFNKMQSLIDRINLVAREGLTGMLVVRAFNREKYEENRFDQANLNLTGVSLFINRVIVILMPFMMFVLSGLSLSIIWIGSHQVADGFMQVGDMMAFMQYSMQIVFAFLLMTMMFILLPRAVVSARRINEVLQTEEVIKDPPNPKTFVEPFKGKVEFRNVSFRYPGAESDVLHNINFTALPGQTTGIIGATGSGKSTLVKLILRFYEATSGEILIDNLNIKEVTQKTLREKIGFVPQKSALFSGTIRSNLLFANENADEQLLEQAIEVSQAKEFVYSKPERFDMEIAQGGMNVSGGQKQRLSIARALVKRAPIYVFDDCVSALDFKTDAALRKALKESTGESTVFMVSQRVSTIKNAEQILVLDEGKIVGKGTHDELMETCPIYREIAISQLELEEVL